METLLEEEEAEDGGVRAGSGEEGGEETELEGTETDEVEEAERVLGDLDREPAEEVYWRVGPTKPSEEEEDTYWTYTRVHELCSGPPPFSRSSSGRSYMSR